MLCPMIDARRMEVYCLLQQASGAQRMPTMAVIVDDYAFREYLEEGEIWFFGNGAEKCMPVIGQPDRARWIPDIHPSAKGIGALAWPKYEQKQFEDVAYFVPFYLKEFRTTKPKKKS